MRDEGFFRSAAPLRLCHRRAGLIGFGGRSSSCSFLCRNLALFLILAYGFTAGGVWSFGATKKEAQVKAVWLFKFLSYADWSSAKKSQSRDAPFVLGILGDDQIAALLKPVENKLVKERKIRLERYKNAAEAKENAKECHVLFIGASEQARLKEILEVLKRNGVLTVGETADFTKEGGIINLTYGETRPLEISDTNMKLAGIKLHSKLRELAK